MKMLWRLLAGGAVAALLLLALASAVFCEATLRIARRAPGDAPPAQIRQGATWRTVAIRSRDGVALEGWFLKPAASSGSRCVMVLHGIADSRLGAAGFAPLFLAAGYSVLTPDSRAHGRSGGELATYGLLEKHDVVDWARWLGQQGCTSVYGLGESLGASILIQASAVDGVFRAVVAECPYADLRAIAEMRARQVSRLPAWLAPTVSGPVVSGAMLYARLRYGLNIHEVAPLKAIAKSGTHILLIHGLADTRTPYWHSQALFRANPRNALWLVPNAEHVSASATDPDGFRLRVLDWFGRR